MHTVKTEKVYGVHVRYFTFYRRKHSFHGVTNPRKRILRGVSTYTNTFPMSGDIAAAEIIPLRSLQQ